MKNKIQIALEGKYYVLAQLAHRELKVTLDKPHKNRLKITRGKKVIELEVKTTTEDFKDEYIFGGKHYCWMTTQKHEDMKGKNLFYCFVRLLKGEQLPEFYIVPSNYVANYVREQHKTWERNRKTKGRKTTVRRFRIAIKDPEGFRNNWKVLGKMKGRN